MKGFTVFSPLLPLDNYNFIFNRSSGSSGVELTQLLETAKCCGSNSDGTCFFL